MDATDTWQEQRRGPNWLLLLLGTAVFAAFGTVVGYAYFMGLPGIGGEPPLIRAAEAPYRHAPSDRGGLTVPNTNSSIVTVLRPRAEPPRVERILPPEPEAPLEAREPDLEAKPPVAALATPEVAADAPPQPDATPAPPSDTGSAAAGAVPGAPYPRSKPGAPEQTAGLDPLQTTISALPPPAPPTPPATAATTPVPPPTATVPPPRETVPPPDAPTGGQQRPASSDPATLKPLRQATGDGIYRLQLAAVRVEGGLTQAWADLRQRYPTALSGVSSQVERTDTTSGPLFRLQAGPFTSRESAADACSSIRGSGGQCFIVGPIGQ